MFLILLHRCHFFLEILCIIDTGQDTYNKSQMVLLLVLLYNNFGTQSQWQDFMVCTQAKVQSVLTSYLCNAQRRHIGMVLDPISTHVYTVMVEQSITFFKRHRKISAKDCRRPVSAALKQHKNIHTWLKPTWKNPPKPAFS